MSDAERIDFLGGQVAALLVFAAAVVKTHRNPKGLAEDFLKRSELQIASSLASKVSEPHIRGQNQIRERLKEILAAS